MPNRKIPKKFVHTDLSELLPKIFVGGAQASHSGEDAVLATFDIQQETYEFTSSITWSFDP